MAGAGTGTFRFEAASGLWTELQVGSYVFMDREYAAIEGVGGLLAPEFRHSLFVLASIVSRGSADRAVANAGLKSMSAEQGRPLVFDLPGAEVIGSRTSTASSGSDRTPHPFASARRCG